MVHVFINSDGYDKMSIALADGVAAWVSGAWPCFLAIATHKKTSP
jgi:hypothetical protein